MEYTMLTCKEPPGDSSTACTLLFLRLAIYIHTSGCVIFVIFMVMLKPSQMTKPPHSLDL